MYKCGHIFKITISCYTSPTIVVYLRVYSSMQLLIVSVRSMVNYLRSPLASVIQVLNMNNGHGGG